MAEDARVLLRCPECGAPLPPSAANVAVSCAQCGATSKPAPKGPEKIVQTIVVERVVVKQGDQLVDATPTCPRCHVAMFPARAHEIVVHGCGLCGGIWLDNEGSTAITKHADPQLGVLAARAEASATMRVSPTRSQQELDCPVCRARMQRVNPSRLAELDICAEHGTWFDAGELRRVMHARARLDDDPMGYVTARRDPVEAQLQAVADASAPPPDPWTFESETAGKVIDGVVIGFLGAMLGPSKRRSE